MGVFILPKKMSRPISRRCFNRIGGAAIAKENRAVALPIRNAPYRIMMGRVIFVNLRIRRRQRESIHRGIERRVSFLSATSAASRSRRGISPRRPYIETQIFTRGNPSARGGWASSRRERKDPREPREGPQGSRPPRPCW